MTPAEKFQAIALGVPFVIAGGVGCYAIITDLAREHVDHDRRPFHPPLNEYEANARAALLDRPRETTVADCARMTVGPIIRFIARQCRACVAAVRAYREAVR